MLVRQLHLAPLLAQLLGLLLGDERGAPRIGARHVGEPDVGSSLASLNRRAVGLVNAAHGLRDDVVQRVAARERALRLRVAVERRRDERAVGRVAERRGLVVVLHVLEDVFLQRLNLLVIFVDLPSEVLQERRRHAPARGRDALEEPGLRDGEERIGSPRHHARNRHVVVALPVGVGDVDDERHATNQSVERQLVVAERGPARAGRVVEVAQRLAVAADDDEVRRELGLIAIASAQRVGVMRVEQVPPVLSGERGHVAVIEENNLLAVVVVASVLRRERGPTIARARDDERDEARHP